jgi:4-hydroxy-3-methylbut-2-enyl diphosphate reductase
MKIEIEKSSGFCFGVENAILMAEEALRSGEKVYSLGQIVHNEIEVERLKNLGLITINHDQFAELTDCKVLIRAHGEPPEIYKTASKNRIQIVEATCPIVKKLQSRVENAWMRSSKTGGQIAIFGKSGHAEVKGLLGQAGGEAILLSNIGDIHLIDYSLPVTLFSQTTRSKGEYNKVIEQIKLKYQESGSDPEKKVTVNNTICGQVANREPALIKFAKKHDIILFVSGTNSSNGRMLFEVCQKVNDSSYFIASYNEVNSDWLSGKESIGLCGATSTPRWLIKEIHEKLSKLILDRKTDII